MADIFVVPLPKSLTKTETYELIEQLNNGSLEAREKLINHNIRLVEYIIKKYFYNVDYDGKDLLSIGIIGLIKAVDTFDISKNIEFTTYSTMCIKNEILMFLRKLKKCQNDDSFERLISEKDDGSLTLEEVLKSDEDIEDTIANKSALSQVRSALEVLPEREKEIVILYYGFDGNRTHTQDEIAKKFGISRSYVSRLVVKTNDILKAELEKREIIDPNINSIKYKKPTINNKSKSIYEYFNDYSRKQVDEMLEKLTDVERKLINYRYTKSIPFTEIEATNYTKLLAKMKKLLIDPYYLEMKKAKQKIINKKLEEKEIMKLHSIYEYLKEYTKEEIDAVLNELTGEEKELLHLRYGTDLNKPTKTNLSKEETNSFYGTLIPKIKRRLKQSRKKAETINSKQSLPEAKKRTTQSNEDKVTSYDGKKLLSLLKSARFEQMISILSVKEAVIISLRLGYVDDKYFSTESIAQFLGIPEDEVRETTIKVLNLYKEDFNKMLDQIIGTTTKEEKSNGSFFIQN